MKYIQKYCKLCGKQFSVDARHPNALYCSDRCNQKAYQISHIKEIYEQRKGYRDKFKDELAKEKAKTFKELKRNKAEYEKFKLKTRLAMKRYRANKV